MKSVESGERCLLLGRVKCKTGLASVMHGLLSTVVAPVSGMASRGSILLIE